MNTGSTIKRQWESTWKVWGNKSYKSFGIEFLVRLILVTLPFLDVGLYLRNISQGKNKLLARKIVTDIYVVINMVLPAIVLYYGWYEYKFMVWICVYLGVMTLTALLARTLLDDLIPAAISYVTAKIDYHYRKYHIHKSNTKDDVEINLKMFNKDIHIDKWYNDRMKTLNLYLKK